MTATPPARLLLLGGTGEAVELAAALEARFGSRLEVTTSLAGRTKAPATITGERRSGGFGGVAGLTRYLRDSATTLIIDATHPFAATISGNAVQAAGGLGLPLLRLSRPPWQPQPGDTWIEVADMAAAAAALAPAARRVWLTTGTVDLAAFSDLAETWFLLRMITAPAAPLPLAHHEVLQARGPFTLDGERAVIARYRIDTLVTKASGGAATAAKLAAAREAGIPVVMIARPVLPPAATVSELPEALNWVAGQLARMR